MRATYRTGNGPKTMEQSSSHGGEDVARIQAFQASSIATAGHNGFLHPGDVPHRMYHAARRAPLEALLTIWEEDGEIASWLLWDPGYREFDLQVHPTVRRSRPAFEADVLERAAKRAAPGVRLEVDGYVGDDARLHALAATGWERRDPSIVVNRRSLHSVPDVELPPGFSIRSVHGEGEAAAVAEVHRRSFGSTWTADEYAAVMRFPGYATERELVAVAPDGRLAGFTVTWLDQVNTTGLFEPVGTHEGYRRMGIARALLAEGMRRMRAAGMRWAIVGNNAGDPASSATYRGSGFEPWLHIDTWSKQL